MKEVTIVFVCLLVIILFIFVITPITNLILLRIGWHIPFPKSNKYKDKKSPIYKLVTLGEDYAVVRYSLKRKPLLFYHSKYDKDSILWYIPFAGLFSYYRYLSDKCFYFSTESKLEEKLNTISIEDYWEKEYELLNEINSKKQSKENKLKALIDKTNGEFNENYI